MDRNDPQAKRCLSWVALLIIGSAICFCSCKERPDAPTVEQTRSLMTQQSEHLTLLYSQDGVLSYRFKTPLLERYEMALEPYMEFRKGVFVQTYNDSTAQQESQLEANYAIFLEKQELWEAKGSVVVKNADGNQLETEQLYWNQKTKRIYSNVDTKLTQGSDVIVGEGFESDERLEVFSFRRPKGRVMVDADSLSTSSSDVRSNDTTSGGESTLPAAREAQRTPQMERASQGERAAQAAAQSSRPQPSEDQGGLPAEIRSMLDTMLVVDESGRAVLPQIQEGDAVAKPRPQMSNPRQRPQ